MTRWQRLHAWARRYLYPPAGAEVRRLIAVLTLAVGIPRLPGVAEVAAFAPQRFGPPEVFGVVCTLAGLALLATAYRQRLTIWGRMAAVVAFAVWITLAAATTSNTSQLLDLAIAASLFVEVGTLRNE